MPRFQTDRAMLAAPLMFVLLWSSSFVTAKIGLRHLSPLLFVAIRLTACAVVLTVLMLALRRSWRPLVGRKWLHCAIAGILLNAIGLMAPHVGLMTAPAAQIALVQSLTPLLTAAFGVFVLREALHGGQWLGLALGLLGVGLVVGEAAFESPVRFQGLVLAFVGVLGLVAGTLYFGRFCRGVPALPGATAQFLAAAAVFALCMAAGNPSRRLDRKHHRGCRLEHCHGFAWGHGPLLRHAGARHRRARKCEFLSRPRHRGVAGVAVPRRATEYARCSGPNYGFGGMLARQQNLRQCCRMTSSRVQTCGTVCLDIVRRPEISEWALSRHGRSAGCPLCARSGQPHRSLFERASAKGFIETVRGVAKYYWAAFAPALRLTVRNVRASGTITTAITPSATNTSI